MAIATPYITFLIPFPLFSPVILFLFYFKPHLLSLSLVHLCLISQCHFTFVHTFYINNLRKSPSSTWRDSVHRHKTRLGCSSLCGTTRLQNTAAAPHDSLHTALQG